MNPNIQRFPLDPEIVGSMVNLPELDHTAFSPSGPWENCYRCDVFGGYSTGPEANRNGSVGRVTVSRQPAVDGTSILTVQETTHYKGGWRREREAQLVLGAEPRGRLLRWKSNITAFGGAARPRHLLDLQESGELTGGQRKLVTNEHDADLAGGLDLVADVQLFDWVQRLPRRAGARWTFDYLEQMRTVRPAHVLLYRGLEPRRWAGRPCSLHRFVQFGAGVAPIDYWVSEAGRLVLVTTTTIAWVLDFTPISHWNPAAN